MINPEELMIGNYLKCSFDKETLLEVTSISKNGFSAHRVGEENKSLHNEAWDGDPIPITHEELLKLGFELKGIIYRINNGSNKQFDVNYSLSRRIYYFDYEKHSIRYEKTLKYIHELQKLYFSLTGKQLRYE